MEFIVNTKQEIGNTINVNSIKGISKAEMMQKEKKIAFTTTKTKAIMKCFLPFSTI